MLSVTRGLASVYSLLSPSKAMAAPLSMEIYNERLEAPSSDAANIPAGKPTAEYL
jgi:hypothetical protein